MNPKLTLGARLLGRLARPEDRDSLLGDLEEGLRRRAGEPRQARRWLNKQVRASVLPVLACRVIDSRYPRVPSPERGDHLIVQLLQDNRFGLRVLRRAPLTTFAILATLALGIGANAAVFSMIRGILVRPLPFEEPADVYLVAQRHNGSGAWASAPNFRDVAERAQSFESIVAYTASAFVATAGAEPERVAGAEVTTDFFAALGVPPLAGRLFDPEEQHVAMAAAGFARRQFGGMAEAVGQELVLDGTPHRIVGVVPSGLMPESAEIWVPISLDEPSWRQIRGISWIRMLGRLADGHDLESARAELATIAADLRRAYPDDTSGMGLDAEPLLETLVGDTRTPLLAMMAAVAVVLLIVCANVAALQIAVAQRRREEVAVRVALGGGRRRIVRQFLTENLLLATLGGLLSVAVAYGAIAGLVRLAPPGTPRLAEVRLDPAALAFCALAALLSGVAFGLLPAWRAARESSTATGAATLPRASRDGHPRGMLVVAQVALSVVLVVGCSLLLKSFWRLQSVDPGFDPDGLLTMGVPLVESNYMENALRAGYLDSLRASVAATPGVDQAALINALPLRDPGPSFSFELRAMPEGLEAPDLLAAFRVASSEYFDTLGIAFRAGRTFTDSGVTDAAPEMVVDEVFVSRFLPDVSPIGAEVMMLDRTFRIVGVVAGIHHRSLSTPPQAHIYIPFHQGPGQQMVVVARTAGDPSALLPSVRTAIRTLEPRQALVLPATMHEWLSRSVATPRFIALILSFFGLSALLLAAVGLHGLLAQVVTQRYREFGIRMAVGAGGEDVVRLVARHGARIVGLGLAFGFVLAWLASGVLSSLLFEVPARDPLSFGAVLLTLAVVGAAACLLPARRAARVDPATALRAP